MLHSPGIDGLLQPRSDGSIPSFHPYVYCDVLSQGVPVATGVPVVGGPVQSNRSQLARRTATVTLIDRTLVPQGGLSDILRLGNEVRIYRGIAAPLPAPEVFPQITGAITRADVTYDQGRPVGATVQIADRGRALARRRFLYPRVLPVGSAKAMLEVLLTEKRPWWTVRFNNVDDQQVSKKTFERERADAVAYLTQSLGAEVFADGYGEWVVQPIPDIDGTPVLQIRGLDGGNLVAGARSISDDGVFNGIVVTGQAAAGAVPHSDPVLDLDPTSLTQWGGPFDEVPGFFDSSLVTNTVQANLVAAAQLRNVVGAAKSVTFSMTPHPGLEVGDLVGVTFHNRDGSVNAYEQHLIDTLSMPLDAGSPITASTRSSRSLTGTGVS